MSCITEVPPRVLSQGSFDLAVLTHQHTQPQLLQHFVAFDFNTQPVQVGLIQFRGNCLQIHLFLQIIASHITDRFRELAEITVLVITGLQKRTDCRF